MALIRNLGPLPKIVVDIIEPQVLIQLLAELPAVHDDHTVGLKGDQLAPFGRARVVFGIWEHGLPLFFTNIKHPKVQQCLLYFVDALLGVLIKQVLYRCPAKNNNIIWRVSCNCDHVATALLRQPQPLKPISLLIGLLSHLRKIQVLLQSILGCHVHLDPRAIPEKQVSRNFGDTIHLHSFPLVCNQVVPPKIRHEHVARSVLGFLRRELPQIRGVHDFDAAKEVDVVFVLGVECILDTLVRDHAHLPPLARSLLDIVLEHEPVVAGVHPLTFRRRVQGHVGYLILPQIIACRFAVIAEPTKYIQVLPNEGYSVICMQLIINFELNIAPGMTVSSERRLQRSILFFVEINLHEAPGAPLRIKAPYILQDLLCTRLVMLRTLLRINIKSFIVVVAPIE